MSKKVIQKRVDCTQLEIYTFFTKAVVHMQILVISN